MKISKIDEAIIKDFRDLLLEQPEEDEPAEDEPAEDEPAEDEPATEEAGEEADEEAGEEAEDSSESETVGASFIDSEIEAVLIDFETKARNSVEENQNENMMYKSGIALLLEEEDLHADIDLDIFASEVARLIKNYDNLLDMESLLMDKAAAFITDKYSEEAAQKLVDTLETKHDLSLSLDPDERDIKTPLAIGASSEGAASA